MKKGEKEFLIKSREFIKKYFFLFAAIILFIISFVIIKRFIIALISAFVLAYLVKPLQRKLSNFMPRKVAALLCLSVIILAVLIPTALLIYGLINQFDNVLALTPNLGSNIEYLDSHFPSIKENILALASNLLKSSFFQLPSLILSLAITVVATYYILSDWETLTKKLEIVIPFKDKKRIRREVSTLTDNIVYGYIFIAIIEFIVGALGFYFSGVKLFLILPALIAILAFIPGLGPAAVWVPTSLYYFVTHDYFTAIGVLITGIIISIFIETLLLPKIIGEKSNIHPMVFLLGVLGGVPVFGLFGFIIGPLILVYTIKLIEESLNK